MAPDSRLAGPDGRGGPHVFVDDLAAPVLAPDDRQHLERSLRLRAGDPLTVGDGHGRWRACSFGDEVEPTGDIIEAVRPAPLLTVGFALVKGTRPELVVQKLTELGIDHIVLVSAERSVVKWDQAKTDKNLARLRRIATEASMQSRRLWLPEVSGLSSVSVLREGSPVALAEPGGRPVAAADHTIVVGPEGGWAPSELDGAEQVGISAQILRAETAAIVAGSVLSQIRAGLVSPAS